MYHSSLHFVSFTQSSRPLSSRSAGPPLPNIFIICDCYLTTTHRSVHLYTHNSKRCCWSRAVGAAAFSCCSFLFNIFFPLLICFPLFKIYADTTVEVFQIICVQSFVLKFIKCRIDTLYLYQVF